MAVRENIPIESLDDFDKDVVRVVEMKEQV